MTMTMTMTMTMMMTMMMMMMMAVVLVAAKPKCTYLYWYLLVLFKPDESERGHTERAAPSPRARKGGGACMADIVHAHTLVTYDLIPLWSDTMKRQRTAMRATAPPSLP
jgi:hypothetical protein